ncbi:hypothetical protein LTR36_000969 [Oleoguttula mirabilis]|uniref:Uncharacterized protein n=1 Tax=Oleoguttula mirabilis TaxID=1507867 RepID=A0AAV9JPJ3_9PEZI|nr:hypothetical protein LTR36_000969 [Oleoguttula mirabilis]
MSVWREAKTDAGRTYYYHHQTKETRWDKPDDFDAAAAPPTPATPAADPATIDASWKEATAASGRKYYYNGVTKVTSWEAPEAFLRQQQNARPAAPAFVAGGGRGFEGGDDYPSRDRRMARRDDRDHLPQKPSFEGGRGGGQPWERRHDEAGFRGPMPAKTDEPEYATQEQAEEAFFKMLTRHNVTPDMAWEDALRQVIKDREYRALKDPKERRQAYDRYCMEVRAQEKGKEKERREKLKEDFRKMLSTHDDIKHYTRWKTARPSIEREAVFRQASDDNERRHMFDEYVVELKRKHVEEDVQQHRTAMQELEGLLQALIVDPDTKWSEAQEAITNNDRFASDDTFRALSNVDLLAAFDMHIKELDRARHDAKQKEKRLHTRRERRARDAFRQLLSQMLAEGKIKAGTRWQDFFPLIATDERYTNLIGTPGSSPLDLFWDVVEEEERKLRSKRNDALDVLEDRRYEMTIATSLDDFAEVMRTDPRTADFSPEQMQMIYDRLMEKILKRAEEDKLHAERHQRKAIDALRSVIKHLEPPVRLGDSYDDVVVRLTTFEEYQVLDDDEARRTAFEKHMRRLKEKDEDLERERARRERDRDHRNGSRRERDDRDSRRHRTRTPEADAYEADRRKAQADRERQYRKASFGLTPPPRERRDDRYDERPRRHDRAESIYDRERREREMERERNYISRADPRDKGRTLDYGDEDAVGSRPGSVRKRRDSDTSARDNKRARRTRTPEPSTEATGLLKEEPAALQSGSEEGEIEEI